MAFLRFFFTLLITCSTVLLGACDHSAHNNRPDESSTPTERIVNGISKNSSFPEVNQLYISRGPFGWSTCTGSWIGAHKFLTAAHCVVDSSGNKVPNNAATVFVELENTLELQESIHIDVHPEFSRNVFVPSDVFPDLRTGVHDLAVITFANPFPAIPAIVTNQPASVGDMLILVGYGSQGVRSADTGVGLMGFTPVDAIDEYRIYWNFDGGSESNTCVGDSGGPGYIDFGNGPRLVAITSAGTSTDCREGDISIDIRIDIYIDWLIEVTEGDLAYDEHIAE